MNMQWEQSESGYCSDHCGYVSIFCRKIEIDSKSRELVKRVFTACYVLLMSTFIFNLSFCFVLCFTWCIKVDDSYNL